MNRRSLAVLVCALAFGAVAMFLVRGRAHRRLLAFLGASMFLVACNVFRIAASIVVASSGDQSETVRATR